MRLAAALIVLVVIWAAAFVVSVLSLVVYLVLFGVPFFTAIENGRNPFPWTEVASDLTTKLLVAS